MNPSMRYILKHLLTGKPLARPVAILCLGLAAAMPTVADTNAVPAYTLEACIEIGLDRAAVLENAARDVEIAGAKVRQTRAQALPELKGSAAYTRVDEVVSYDLGSGPITMGKLDNYSAGLSASQLLFSGGQVSAALRAAKLYRNYSSLAAEQKRQALIRDIQTSFYGILLAAKQVEVEQESVRQLEDFVRQTDDKFRNGKASEFDLLTAQVRLANNRPDLVRARNQLAVAREAFRNLLHLDESDFALSGELSCAPEPTDLDALQRQGLEERREIKQQVIWVDLLQQNTTVARADYWPTIRAVAAYDGSNPDSYSTGTSDWGWHWSAGLTAEWSFMDGGLRGGKVLESKLELFKAETDLDELKKAVLLEIKQAHLDLQHAQEALTGSRENVLLAEKALAIARTRYEAGLSTYLEFTETNLALSTARLAYYSATRDYLDARARLDYACGAVNPSTTEEPAR